MYEKIIIYLSLTNAVKMWQNSNIWEQQQQMKIAFTKKLRAQ